MLKPSLLRNSSYYCLIHCWGMRGSHTFPKGISLKVNILAGLGYYDSAVQHFSLDTMGTPPIQCKVCFRDRRQVDTQLLFHGMLLPAFVLYSSLHSLGR